MASDQKNRRRWLPRLRFSLRTLLLAVLLAGSGATLWWNWAPWAPVLSIDVKGPIDSCAYSHDDQAIFVKLDTATGRSMSPSLGVKVYDLNTGRLKLDLPKAQNKRYELSPGGRYVLYSNYRHSIPELWAIDSAASIDLKAIESDDISQLDFSDDDRVMILSTERRVSVLKMPEMRIIARISVIGDSTRWAQLGKWLVHLEGSRVRFYSTETGHLERTWSVPAEAGSGFDVSPSGDTVAFYDPESDDGPVLLCDGKSGRLIGELKDGVTANGLTRDGAYSMRNCGTWKMTPPHKLYRRICWALTEEKNNSRNPIIGGRVDEDESHKNRLVITDSHTGVDLFRVPPWDLKSQCTAGYCGTLSNGKPEFVTWGRIDDNYAYPNTPSRIYIWRPRRPLGRLNFLWMPEFWLTSIFAVALAWSIWRDRRMA